MEARYDKLVAQGEILQGELTVAAIEEREQARVAGEPSFPIRPWPLGWMA
jgi:hypothetical protein